jgi:cytochrome c551/c552
MKRILIILAGAALMATLFSCSREKPVPVQQTQPAAQPATPALEQMIAAGKNPQEIAESMFDTHGCKNCHTLGQDGKFGFTDKGKELAKGFEGCISMLTAMNVIAQVPDDKRTPEERRKAARFQEFGCTACHKITPGKMGLTEVGAKLTHLHLGCVEVQKLLAGNKAPVKQ